MTRARSALLTVLLFGAASCDRPAERRLNAGPPAGMHDGAAHVAGAGPIAPVDTTVRLPAAIAEGCGDLHALFTTLARTDGLREPAPGPRDTTMVFGGFDEVEERACYTTWSDSLRGLPYQGLLAQVKAHGWVERPKLLSADGPDGSLLAISRGDVACVLDLRWEGDDDSDSTYVPAPGFTAIASCFRNRPDRY